MWGLPCCCGLSPAAAGSATGSALLPQALPCSRVSLLWHVASAMAGCISNGSVPLSGRISSVMANAPPPPSCTVLGSAVLAVKLSTWSVSNCHFVCPSGGETRRACSPGPLPQSAFLFFFFFKLNGWLFFRCSSHLLKGRWDLCDFLCSDPLRWLESCCCPGIS